MTGREKQREREKERERKEERVSPIHTVRDPRCYFWRKNMFRKTSLRNVLNR